MGLFVAEDGQYQGWLAAFLCCCAAITDDESPIEKQKERSSNKNKICNEQPRLLPSMPSDSPVLTLNALNGNVPSIDGTRNALHPFDQPPLLSPLDLGDIPLLSSWPHQASPNKPSVSYQRPSISAPIPLSFRRLDHTEPQRQGLVPLRLGPVVLRASPAPEECDPSPLKPVTTPIHGQSNSTEELLADNARPRSYRANRESPFQRCRQSSVDARRQAVSTEPVCAHGEEEESGRPAISTRSSSSSMRKQGMDTPTSSVKSRSSSERQRPKRKRSFPIGWKDGDDRLEQEILELNTIVEERRAEATRENLSDQHVPAVAPSMQVRARSETLNSIGSALSRPLPTHQRDASASAVNTSRRLSIRRSLSATSWTSSRFSGWLSGLAPSSSPANSPTGEPFYKCQLPPSQRQRAYSEATTCTSSIELDGSSRAAASSLVSGGHSRSHTDESWITPVSPFTPRGELESRGTNKMEKVDHWPIRTTSAMEVGLAL